MVKFLVNRPVAVSMVFLSMLSLGFVSLNYIPVSLMPDIDVPEISVQLYARSTSARELENTVVTPIRRQLQQASHLADIKSETRNEVSIITLRFDYGTDVDYAYVEVNELVDRMMGMLPHEMDRPKIIKASAVDIPVFYLNVRLKAGNTPSVAGADQATTNDQRDDLVELSRFSEQVIRKRIEQLPQVSMVDMSGLVYQELVVIPHPDKMDALGVTLTDIEDIIKNNNIRLGSFQIKEDQYEYNVQVDSEIKDVHDLEDIYINRSGRLFRLGDLASIAARPARRSGLITVDGIDAVSMAVIKQSDAQMSDLKTELHKLVDVLKADYPDLDFVVSLDQTQLLDYAVVNLGDSLLAGTVLSFLVMFFFMKDFRSPLLVGLTVPISLVITILFFQAIGITINVVSLAGLILGVGTMIDNSIIVIDNIAQYHSRGYDVVAACVRGTSEVIRPLLSSVLTNCAVFVPLIFLSGIAGALFFDQAVAVALGLFVSFLVSITLVPVYYNLLYRRQTTWWIDRKLRAINGIGYEDFYERGFKWVIRNQRMAWFFFIAVIVSGLLVYRVLPRSVMPPISRNDFVLRLDWNDRITVDENKKRTHAMLAEFRSSIEQDICFVGMQQFMLKADKQSSSESSIYIKTTPATNVSGLMEQLRAYLGHRYPQAVFDFEWADNIFDLVFKNAEAPVVIKLVAIKNDERLALRRLEKTHARIQQFVPDAVIPAIPLQKNIVLKVDGVKANTYHISLDAISTVLLGAFNEKKAAVITSREELIPIVLGSDPKAVEEAIASASVSNDQGEQYPLRDLVHLETDEDMKVIVSGQDGAYFPIEFQIDESGAGRLIDSVRVMLAKDNWFRAEVGGSIFENEKITSELVIVLLVSFLLLYFILASQFESISIPLIILLELPVGILGAFIFLAAFGAGINLMSMIGIVIMGGIIINDSILKIDTINQLRREEKMSPLRSVLVAGKRRLKAILMTSLTTILSLLPVLFSDGLGADLQKPLALANIGGMIIGTFVSLYFIPLCYLYILKKQSKAV